MLEPYDYNMIQLSAVRELKSSSFILTINLAPRQSNTSLITQLQCNTAPQSSAAFNYGGGIGGGDGGGGGGGDGGDG